MSVTTSPWIPVLIILGVLAVVAVAFIWWRKAKQQKNKEAEETRRILETPLEQFGATEVDELAKKYQSDTDSDK